MGFKFAMNSFMSNGGARDLIYLCANQEVPAYLAELRGARWHWARDPEQLKQILKMRHGEVCVIVRTEKLTERVVQAFLTWTKVKPKLSFIFIAQAIENTVYQLTLNSSAVLVVRESEGRTITNLVSRCLNGLSLKSRRQERIPVDSPVMLKKFNADPQSPIGSGMQFLREGEMKDFSQGGALIKVKDGMVSSKDFVSLMYQDANGKWVSIESQVRWVSTSPLGQVIGVQFLATGT